MQVFGIKFNLANIWACRSSSARGRVRLNVILSHLEARPRRATGRPQRVLGVALNGITTMVGFGSS